MNTHIHDNKAFRRSVFIWLASITIFIFSFIFLSKVSSWGVLTYTALFFLITAVIIGVISFCVMVFLAVKLFLKNGLRVNILFIVPVLLLGFLIYKYIGLSQRVETNGNQFTCKRKEPYTMPPEFERALSLRLQRNQESKTILSVDSLNYYNCVNIKYEDLNANSDPNSITEGEFRFDEHSKLDELTIYVDTSYKARDDILTAILLNHEFAHVSQFLTELTTGKRVSCVDKEVGAFIVQLHFMLILNNEEKRSLEGRLTNYSDQKYQMTLDLLHKHFQAEYKCGKANDNNACYWSKIESDVREMVTSSKAYQKQCNL